MPSELDREAARSRKALEQMPEGKADWKPHDRSMAFGYLSELVATMPTWILMTIERDELDIAPAAGAGIERPSLHTAADYLQAHDKAVAAARAALQKPPTISCSAIESFSRAGASCRSRRGIS